MGIQFKNYPKGSLIGSGTYQFRHYGNESIPLIIINTGETSTSSSVYGSYIVYNGTTYYTPQTINVQAGDNIEIYGKSKRTPVRNYLVGVKLNSTEVGNMSSSYSAYTLLYTYTVPNNISRIGIKFLEDGSGITTTKYTEILTR